jgi:hypothetical protein
MRLGVVLVRMGYAPRPAVEDAIRMVREQLSMGHPAAPAHMFASGQAPPPGQPAAPAGPASFGPAYEPDEPPTIIGPPEAFRPPDQHYNPFASVRDTAAKFQGAPLPGAPSPGGPPLGEPPPGLEDAPTRMGTPAVRAAQDLAVSGDELNPFLEGGSAPARPPSSEDDLDPFGQPRGPEEAPSRPLPSIDELDAFSDMPLPPSGGQEPSAPAPGAPPAPVRQGGPVRSSGLTPTGVPVGGQADSDSSNVRAPRKRKRAAEAKSGGGSGLLLVVLLLAAVALLGGIGALLYFYVL